MENTLLNLIPSSYIPEVHLSQYDIGRNIQFKLMDGNSEYDVPSGATVKILATKPSGLGFEVACTFSGNIVTLVNTETMSNESGRFRAELRITSGATILGTSNFIMNVERSPHPEGTIDGDAETLLPELTLLVERIEDSNARIESMTATATTLAAGEDATAEYDSANNQLVLGLPRGEKGEQGEGVASLEPRVSENKTAIIDINNDLSVLAARMDTFSSLPSGSTSGDAELLDIRVGANGQTYSTAGDAVRGQVSELTNDFTNFVPRVNALTADDLYDEGSLADGYLSATGVMTAQHSLEKEMTTDFLAVDSTDTILFMRTDNVATDDVPWQRWCWFNANKDFISSSSNTAYKIIGEKRLSLVKLTPPQNAKYLRISWRSWAGRKGKIFSIIQKSELADASNYFSVGVFNGEYTDYKFISYGIYALIDGKYVPNGATKTRIVTDFIPIANPTLSVSVDTNAGYQFALSFFENGDRTRDTGWRTSFDETVQCDCFTVAIKKTVDGTDQELSLFDPNVGLTINVKGVYSLPVLNKGLTNLGVVNDRMNYLPSTYAKLKGQKFYGHLFIDTIDTQESASNTVYPNQSIWDFTVARRLGFSMVEANVHKTSDGKYIVMHGASGNIGWELYDPNGTDITNIAISSIPFDTIRGYRYRSKYAKYRTQVTSLEEFLYFCKTNDIVPFMMYTDDNAIQIARNIVGNEFVLYGARRIKFDGIMYHYGFPGETVSQIKSAIVSIGAPYIHGIYPTTFNNMTDAELDDLVAFAHNRNCMLGVAESVLTEPQLQRAIAHGIDIVASSKAVNNFESGNLDNVIGDMDFSEFVTNGTVTDGILHLDAGQQLSYTSPQTPSLSKGVLHIRYNGTAYIGLSKSPSEPITSNGDEIVVSSLYVEDSPKFIMTATTGVDVYTCTFKTSIC